MRLPGPIVVVTGLFLAESGKSFLIYTQLSEDRIRDERGRIHLYVWLDDFKGVQLFLAAIIRRTTEIFASGSA